MSVCLVVCDLETSTIGRPRPELACCDTVPREVGIVLEAVSLTHFASGFLRQISNLGFTCFSALFCVLRRVLFDGKVDICK